MPLHIRVGLMVVNSVQAQVSVVGGHVRLVILAQLIFSASVIVVRELVIWRIAASVMLSVVSLRSHDAEIGGGGTAFNVPATQTCSTTGSFCDTAITESKPSSTCPPSTGVGFLGWSTNPSATSATYSPGATITLNQDLTLYAIWSPYDNSGGVSVMCGFA